MFSALTQGSLIYILDKTDTPKISTGKIVGISQPKFSGNQMFIDIKADVDGEHRNFPDILSTASVFSYNNSNVIISESQAGLEGEIRRKLSHINSILEHWDDYKSDKEIYESLLKSISPVFAKDKERDEKLSSLGDKVVGIESRLDKILELIGGNKQV